MLGTSASTHGETRKATRLVRGLLRTLRPHQWVKNLFVFAPVFFHRDLVTSSPYGPLLNLRVAAEAGLATLLFCLLAGAIYTINDLVDVEADRAHPIKRNRPIASGDLPERFARPLVVVLVLGALATGAWLSLGFAAAAGVYFVLNIAYSLKLKQIAYLDVIIIATGFVLRVVAGGYATNVQPSFYMLACTALLSLFLGFGKRRNEVGQQNATKQRAALERYERKHLDAVLVVTGLLTLGMYVAYTLDPFTQMFFGTRYLWITSIFTAFGLYRFAHLIRDTSRESPTQAMLSDVPFLLNLVAWVAAVIVIVYRLRPAS